MVGVKIKNLPFNVTYEQIEYMFKDHSPVERSAIIGTRLDGMRSGYGTILCDSEDCAK